MLRRIHPSGLVVGGYQCPTSGEIAGRQVPDDKRYYLTSFGGGSDTQGMACGGTADGTWYYLADSWRFPCGTKVRITNPANGKSVVAQVADVGPNVCVEQAAGLPVLDASPLVSQALFGSSSSGWADRRLVIGEVVDASTPLGLWTGGSDGSTSGKLLGLASLGVGGWLLWQFFR